MGKPSVEAPVGQWHQQPPLLKKKNTRAFYDTELQKYKGSERHQGGSVLSNHLLITQKPFPHAFF